MAYFTYKSACSRIINATGYENKGIVAKTIIESILIFTSKLKYI